MIGELKPIGVNGSLTGGAERSHRGKGDGGCGRSVTCLLYILVILSLASSVVVFWVALYR